MRGAGPPLAYHGDSVHLIVQVSVVDVGSTSYALCFCPYLDSAPPSRWHPYALKLWQGVHGNATVEILFGHR